MQLLNFPNTMTHQGYGEVTGSLLPTTPKQRIASLMLAAWADAWWEPFILYYRWGNNKPKVHKLGSKVSSLHAKRLEQRLLSQGVTPEQYQEMELWSLQCFQELETHLFNHSFILGEQASLADYALLSPVHSYLKSSVDRIRKQNEVRYPQLNRWLQRMTFCRQPSAEELVGDDQLPETLEALYHRIFSEFIPMIHGFVAEIKGYVASESLHAGATLPVSLGKVIYPMGDQLFVRRCEPKAVRALQIVQAEYLGFNEWQKRSVDPWLMVNNMRNFGEMDLGPKLVRNCHSRNSFELQ